MPRPIYHSKDQRIRLHILLLVVVRHAVQLIRTRLKRYGLHSGRATLQFKLNQCSG